jgi:hypothetical protein
MQISSGSSNDTTFSNTPIVMLDESLVTLAVSQKETGTLASYALSFTAN